MPNMYIGGSCDLCGATVEAGWSRGKHNEFHEKFDELVDWAQAVSKLFATPQEVKSGETPSTEL